MSAPPNMIAGQLAEALRELRRELADPDIVVDFEELPEIHISPRTERLVSDALRAYDGNSA